MLRRVGEFAAHRALELHRRLGFGKDGSVWETDQDTAVKVFRDDGPFRREWASYQRLKRRGVVDINGFRVPQVVRVDE